MRRVMLGLLIATLAFAACTDDDASSGAGDEPTGAQETSPAEPQEEYVIIEGGEEFAITESCVDTNGQYTGNLPEGGLFILREGIDPEGRFVDFLPSQDADPLSSKEAEDTTVSNEGGFVTGTTTVYTEDGANSLSLEFGIVRDTSKFC
jgi:hypothetical protein